MGWGVLQDLECHVTGSVDENNQQPIPDGGVVFISGGSIWLHFTATLKGAQKPQSFKILSVAAKNGSAVHSAQESVTLSSLEPPKTLKVPVDGWSTSNTVSAFMVVDVDETVVEGNAQNNFASYSCAVAKGAN